MHLHAHSAVATRALQSEIKRGPLGFDVLDNGATPFHVHIDPSSTVRVYRNVYRYKGLPHPKLVRRVLLLQVARASSVWVGQGEYDDWDSLAADCFSNTALIVRGRKVWSVASDIRTFTLAARERVVEYVSSVGNSSVPYGFIRTSRGVYVLESFNCDTGFLPTAAVPPGANMSCVSRNPPPDLVARGEHAWPLRRIPGHAILVARRV